MRRHGAAGRRLVPPPSGATWADAYRLALGGLMIPLGVTILVRCFTAGIITPPAVIMGLVFVAFGAYRLYTGIVRYRIYRAGRRQG